MYWKERAQRLGSVQQSQSSCLRLKASKHHKFLFHQSLTAGAGGRSFRLSKVADVERGYEDQTKLPAGMSFSKVTDQSAIIKQAVGEFQLKFFVALLLVMLVSLISLGWRVGIVVASAVPLTLSATLVIMLATGKDLDLG
jgi:hypothetical protein